MTKPELPPLPKPANSDLDDSWIESQMMDYGLACYRAGMLRAAEVILQHKNDYNGAQIDPLLSAIGERAAIDAATSARRISDEDQ